MAKVIDDFHVKLHINAALIEKKLMMQELIYDFNQARPRENEKRNVLLKQLLGRAAGVNILPPFYCDFGENIFFTEGGFLNYGVTILDIAPVYIGKHVQIGPNVIISTVGHPSDLAERMKPFACGDEIHIGDNVWIGAGAIVLGGVTIGDRSIIGAGSIVTKDIPADVIAVGNPCRVIKSITHGEMPSEATLMEWWGE